MTLYDHVRDLPLVVEAYGLDGHELTVRPEFVRRTTVIRLQGAGEEGVGEDVTYDGAEHERQQARGPVLPLAGEWTLDSFSQHLATLQLFEQQPEQHAALDYRRWAFESAALDLALRQTRRFARRRGRARAATGHVRRLRRSRRARPPPRGCGAS